MGLILNKAIGQRELALDCTTIMALNINIERRKRNMNIKNKTELRKIIKRSIGNTESLDKIEFYSDGTWEQLSGNTYSNDWIVRSSLGSLSTFYGYNETIDRAITSNFLNIETEIIRANNQGG